MKSKTLGCITCLFFLLGMVNFSPAIAANLPVPVNLAQISTSEPDQSVSPGYWCMLFPEVPRPEVSIYQESNSKSRIIRTLPKGWLFHPPMANDETEEKELENIVRKGWYPIGGISNPIEGQDLIRMNGFLSVRDITPYGCASPASPENDRRGNNKPPQKKP
ncbi:hypothetical protein LEP3755_62270 [Leptolyngbya sp. NIES-3755]|nr:hypothetical protein LEP3755_62270 [Leptolyngbya sp. NIES-3755]